MANPTAPYPVASVADEDGNYWWPDPDTGGGGGGGSDDQSYTTVDAIALSYDEGSDTFVLATNTYGETIEMTGDDLGGATILVLSVPVSIVEPGSDDDPPDVEDGFYSSLGVGDGAEAAQTKWVLVEVTHSGYGVTRFPNTGGSIISIDADADPNAGIAADRGTIGVQVDGSSRAKVWFKFGEDDTDWERLNGPDVTWFAGEVAEQNIRASVDELLEFSDDDVAWDSLLIFFVGGNPAGLQPIEGGVAATGEPYVFSVPAAGLGVLYRAEATIPEPDDGRTLYGVRFSVGRKTDGVSGTRGGGIALVDGSGNLLAGSRFIDSLGVSVDDSVAIGTSGKAFAQWGEPWEPVTVLLDTPLTDPADIADVHVTITEGNPAATNPGMEWEATVVPLWESPEAPDGGGVTQAQLDAAVELVTGDFSDDAATNNLRAVAEHSLYNPSSGAVGMASEYLGDGLYRFTMPAGDQTNNMYVAQIAHPDHLPDPTRWLKGISADLVEFPEQVGGTPGDQTYQFALITGLFDGDLVDPDAATQAFDGQRVDPSDLTTQDHGAIVDTFTDSPPGSFSGKCMTIGNGNGAPEADPGAYLRLTNPRTTDADVATVRYAVGLAAPYAAPVLSDPVTFTLRLKWHYVDVQTVADLATLIENLEYLGAQIAVTYEGTDVPGSPSAGETWKNPNYFGLVLTWTGTLWYHPLLVLDGDGEFLSSALGSVDSHYTDGKSFTISLGNSEAGVVVARDDDLDAGAVRFGDGGGFGLFYADADPGSADLPVGSLWFNTTSGDVWRKLTAGAVPWVRWNATNLAGVWQRVASVTLSGTTTKSTNSTSKTPIDSTNLGYQTVDLAVGDRVRCTLAGSAAMAANGQNVHFDYEVDQPTSANVYIAGSRSGVVHASTTARQTVCCVAEFVATEAGTHGFRPVWKVTSSTAYLYNDTSANDDVLILFEVDVCRA